jgi:hypothetical protein
MQKLFLRALIFVTIAAALFIALPQASASADICNPGEIYCMPDAAVQLQNQDQCSDPTISNLFGAGSPTSCVSSQGSTLPAKQGIYIPVISDVVIKLTQLAQQDAQFMLTFILVDQLGGRNVQTTPVLVCADTQNEVHAACAGQQEWFLGQYKLMRDISLYVMIPLFLLMVIQSIIKGSLQNLLRSALFMFPIAVIGSAVAIVFMQMFLNITDDFCNYIVDRATTGLTVGTCLTSDGQVVTSTACGLKNSLAERSLGSSGLFFALIWFIVLMAACVAIYLELVGRQIGVYMMALMLPLVMAGLVWSRTIGIAKKVFQYELALIISKVFIVAALSLGMGAYAHTSSTTCTNGANGAAASGVTCTNSTDTAGATQSTNQSWQALASGTLIILLAAFAGAKVVTLSPAAMAGQAPVWNKGAIASRGQVISVIQQRAQQLQGWRSKNRKPGDNFKNNASSSSSSSSSDSSCIGVPSKSKKGKGGGGEPKAPEPPGGSGNGPGGGGSDPTDSPDGGGKKPSRRQALEKRCIAISESLEKFSEKLEEKGSSSGDGKKPSLTRDFLSNWRQAKDDMNCRQNRWHFSNALRNGGDMMDPNYADSTTADTANQRYLDANGQRPQFR